MFRFLVRAGIVASFCCLLSVSAAMAQDFQRSYQLGAGGSIRVSNVSGNINVSGYDGNAVIVNAFKEGRDSNQVEIEDRSAGDRVDIGVQYPRNCNCDASVRFEVQVPRAGRYNFERISTASGDIRAQNFAGNLRASTASGEVEVTNVSGEIRASSASGNVNVRNATGEVNASSASGDVDVEIAQLEGAARMTFSSASGDVRVKMPSNLDAEVNLSTVGGSVQTTFPLQVQRRQHGAGEYARGRLGSGAGTLRISSASGNVRLESF